MNFLIVEDNDNMRRVIGSILSDFAGELYERSDPAEALAAFAEHLPDWVLMDLGLGTKDGIAAIRQIKASFPEARIMIVTDYDDAELRHSALEAGAAECVVKANLLDICRILQSDLQSKPDATVDRDHLR
jgi:CheY-like chemotaxis protein